MMKSRLKKKECLNHRKQQYYHALDKLIAGTASPEYVTLRWNKLKEVMK